MGYTVIINVVVFVVVNIIFNNFQSYLDDHLYLTVPGQTVLNCFTK